MIVLLGLFLACRPAAPVAPAPEPAAVVAPIPAPAPPAGAIARDRGDAREPLPMVVALHGRGDDAAHFLGAFEGLDGVRVVALEGPHPAGDGAAWLTGSARELPPEVLAAEIGTQADDVARRIAEARAAWPTVGAPVVTGFSQGAVMSWAIAVHHPDVVAGAVPVAGFLPEASLAAVAPGRVPIRALHGTADDVLPYAWDARTHELAVAAGLDATLTPFDGVAHRAPPPVHDAWMAAIRELVPVSR